jgi:hypothetical protein
VSFKPNLIDRVFDLMMALCVVVFFVGCVTALVMVAAGTPVNREPFTITCDPDEELVISEQVLDERIVVMGTMYRFSCGEALGR